MIPTVRNRLLSSTTNKKYCMIYNKHTSNNGWSNLITLQALVILVLYTVDYVNSFHVSISSSTYQITRPNGIIINHSQMNTLYTLREISLVRILKQQVPVLLFSSNNDDNNDDDWYSDFNPETSVYKPPQRNNYSNNNNNNNQYSNDRDRYSYNNNDRGGRGGRGGDGSRGGRGGRGSGGGRGRGRGGGGGGGRIIYERDTSIDTSNVDVSAVERLIDDRTQARQQNNFDRADEIRDILLDQYGVQVWDKDRLWRTGASRSGSGLQQRRSSSNSRFGDEREGGGRGRGRFGDRNGGRSQRPPKDFGPNGHDYLPSPDSGPMVVDISESQIHDYIAARLRAKMSRNFDEADRIQGQLLDAGVYIHDARKEWRADGIMFGDFAKSDGRPGRERQSRRDRESAPYEQSLYSAGIDSLTEEEITDITALVSRRNGAKVSRNYMTADRIRDELKAEYNVFIEDRLRQWSVGGDFGPDSAARDESRFKPWTMSAYSEPLTDEDQESAILVQLEERNEAKAARNFDAADDIRDFLLSEYNVVIDDRLREWSIGGDFGTVRKRGGSDEAYTRRGGGDLTPEQEAEVIDIVSVRAVAKKKRDFATADELRDVLDTQFDVKVDDKTKEWWVKTASYTMGRQNNRLADALDDETISYIQERLQERLEYKNDKQYDAADEIRDELRERFGVTVDDRMQEWVVEVDQYTVVDNNRRTSDTNPMKRQSSTPPPSYSVEDDDDDNNNENEYEIDDTISEIQTTHSVDEDMYEINGSNTEHDNTLDNGSDDMSIISSSNEVDNVQLENLTIPELKERLRAIGLPVSGKKSELIERLSQSS